MGRRRNTLLFFLASGFLFYWFFPQEEKTEEGRGISKVIFQKQEFEREEMKPPPSLALKTVSKVFSGEISSQPLPAKRLKPNPFKFRKRVTAKEEGVLEKTEPLKTAKRVKLSDLNLSPRLLAQLENEASGETQAVSGDNSELISGGGVPALARLDSSASADGDFGKDSEENIGPYHYRVLRFMPGMTKSGNSIRPVPDDLTELHRSVVGPPDFSLATDVPAKDRLLSLGNGGEIVFEVLGGSVYDGSGPDFVVFENPFVIKGAKGGEVYAETAYVSVAFTDDEKAYRTFPCDPQRPPFKGCAGVTPVRYSSTQPLDQVGGDPFDLEEIGLSEIRYIRIQDTGDNESFMEGTEGFDLDALALIHILD